jgi:hypothetical protein
MIGDALNVSSPLPSVGTTELGLWINIYTVSWTLGGSPEMPGNDDAEKALAPYFNGNSPRRP